MEPFVTFRRFNDPGQAQALGELLEAHQVPYELEDNSVDNVITRADSASGRDYRVKLRAEDFARAEELLAPIFAAQMAELPADYYLFSFTDAELMEVILKKDEWGQLDFMLAQHLLRERGKEVAPEVVALMGQRRISELAQPAPDQDFWITAGYFLAIAGGVLGVLTGLYLWQHHRTLPNGRRVPAHSPRDRRHGKWMTGLGLLMTLLWAGARVLAQWPF
ncbi:MAG: hypothetical protein MUC97_16065 [Bernardetiaceae bacterium]|jgi:hypothetical protein|nr:hypothetical protein [Bernardetiaceae bacterium]